MPKTPMSCLNTVIPITTEPTDPMPVQIGYATPKGKERIDQYKAPRLASINAAVATITLNRPKAFNAFNAQLRRELLKTVQDLEANAAVRVVVIRGNGPGFCAGADLGEGFPDPISEQIEAEYKPFLMAIAESRKIYIAQVHGTAAGIGAALAMSCDLMTMADTASIYMAFAAVALVPDGGNTWFLLRAMGYARALAAILEGTKIPASDCLTYGIANRLFAPDQLDAETVDWASKLAKGAPLAIGLAHEAQIVAAVPVDEFDQPLDWVVTEGRRVRSSATPNPPSDNSWSSRPDARTRSEPGGDQGPRRSRVWVPLCGPIKSGHPSGMTTKCFLGV